ncbi:peptide ABC transporter substrate-binding protein [Clostridium botulinum]|nr:peptide ABC transporter substrate-binding protein [Clostridium botulinum]NFL03626.1 peptide ABC transporter substrate-binding protein [Clostridium botulinum]
MKKKFYIFIISSICISLILIVGTGCIHKKVYNENVRDYLVYNVDSLPEDLLLVSDNNIRKQDLNLCLFEGLVSFDKEGKTIPALASEWKISSDKLTYTFNIRENAMWSNGDKIVAKDFEDFFSRILKEKNNIYRRQLECIFGVKDYINNDADFSRVAISSKDEEKLEIRLNYPCEDFLKILREPAFTLKRNFYNLRNWKSEYRKINYSGAFIIDNIYDNGEISLLKNDKYWDKDSVISKKVHIKNKETTAFALADYNSNSIDVFCNDDITELSDIPKSEKLKKTLTNKGVSLNFNLNKDGFARDIKFRKAIKYAVNRENIEKSLNGLFTKSYRYLPEEIKKNVSINYQANLVKAKEFLNNSGYGGETVEVVYSNGSDNNKKIVNSILKDLESLKIKAEAKGYDKEELKNIVDNDKYDIIIKDYKGEYNSSLCYLEKWVSSNKFNVYGYRNVKFDNAVLKGKVSIDKAQSNTNYKNAEDILLEDIPIIPLGFYDFVLCKKSYVEGIEINNMGNIIIKKSHIKNKK